MNKANFVEYRSSNANIFTLLPAIKLLEVGHNTDKIVIRRLKLIGVAFHI